MKIRTVRLLVKEGSFNVYKNKLMSFASLATVIATLFILGLVLLIVVNVTTNIDNMKKDLEVVAFLERDASILEKEEVGLYIEENRKAGIVLSYRLETADEFFESLKTDLRNNEQLLEDLSPDIFPDCYYIKLNHPDYSNDFIAKLKLYEGIDADWISYPKDELDKLSGTLRVVNYVTIFILIVLVIVSILLISNTIRLTVYARRKEIEIMKYVGALDWFIRLPFIVEGMIIGLAGSLVSFFFTSQTYSWIKNGLDTLFASAGLPYLRVMEFSPVALRVLVIYVIFGMTMGIIGSFMSVRKHLNV